MKGLFLQSFWNQFVENFILINWTKKRNTQIEPQMNTLLKNTAIALIVGISAGTAYAGPGDAYAAHGSRILANKMDPVGIALFRTQGQTPACPSTSECPVTVGCSMKVKTVALPNVNPKTHTATSVQVTTCR